MTGRTQDVDVMTQQSSQDPILARIRSSVRAWEQILQLEMGGRAILVMTSGHMHEICAALNGDPDDPTAAAVKYFTRFYNDHIREFIQQDDVAFVTHHCNRILFEHWQEELQALKDGAMGEVLTFPEPRPPTPEKNRAIASYWYDDVKQGIEAGQLPTRKHRNPVMQMEERRAWELQTQGAWWGSLTWMIEVWGAQVPLMWRILRDTITLRQEEERRGAAAVRRIIAADLHNYRVALDEYNGVYASWHERHAETLTVHLPFFRKFLVGVEDWLESHGEGADTMPIAEPMKDELYLEVACAVAELRGEPFALELPQFEYWRRTPWTPEPMVVGAPGMPPFPGQSGPSSISTPGGTI